MWKLFVLIWGLCGNQVMSRFLLQLKSTSQLSRNSRTIRIKTWNENPTHKWHGEVDSCPPFVCNCQVTNRQIRFLQSKKDNWNECQLIVRSPWSGLIDSLKRPKTGSHGPEKKGSAVYFNFRSESRSQRRRGRRKKGFRRLIFQLRFIPFCVGRTKKSFRRWKAHPVTNLINN